MPEITEKDFLNQVKERSFSPIYFIYGEDVFLRQQYVKKLCDAVVTELPEMNFRKFDGKTVSLQQISDEVYQFPLMSDKRLVLVDDLDIPSLDKEGADVLFDIFEDVPETTVLAFVFNTIVVDVKDKKSPWPSLVKKLSKFGDTINCAYKTDAELMKYIDSWSKKRGVIFDRSVAKHLIDTVGRDMNKLQVEVDKLCAFKKDYVSKADIDKLSAKTAEATQYMLPKAVMSLNISNSLNILSDLFDMRYKAIDINSMLINEFVDIYRVKTAIDCGNRPTSIAEDFGYKNRLFVLENAERHAKKYSFKTLMDCFDILENADERLKSGEKNERMLLEKTIILLIETMRGYNIKWLKLIKQ